MPAGIRDYVKQHSPLIDEALRSLLPVSKLAGADRLNRAIEYAVLGGGKRMRPVLALLSAEICGAAPSAALEVGCAVEFLHAASLALDDLPVMDDAAMRRGRAAVHVRFGGDIAILASLALLNESYKFFARYPGLLRRAVEEIGVDGMIGGQAVDVCGSNSEGRMEKTTALTRLSMAAGASAAGASQADSEVLVAFGHAMGEAYQICDDIADAFGSAADLGKTAGQDQRHGRFSIVDELGTDRAYEHAADLLQRACGAVHKHFGRCVHATLLEEFANGILVRGLELAR